MKLRTLITAALAALLATSGVRISNAAPVTPYTEDFPTNAAQWTDGVPSGFAIWQSSGGPDGSSYISVNSNTSTQATDASLILFRGQDETNASSSKFVGDWLAGGINHFSAYVYHNAPVPLEYFVRFATASNFPGTAAIDGTLVAPNTWTKLSYDIVPSQINVTLFPEGPPSFFNSTFTSLGHIQIGFNVPASMANSVTSYTYGLDQVSVAVPEPASWLLAFGAGAFGVIRRRHRAA